MILSLKASVAYKKMFTLRRTTLSVVEQPSSDITRLFAGHCPMSGANIRLKFKSNISFRVSPILHFWVLGKMSGFLVMVRVVLGPWISILGYFLNPTSEIWSFQGLWLLVTLTLYLNCTFLWGTGLSETVIALTENLRNSATKPNAF